MIKFSCPSCNKRYKVKLASAGKKAKCAGCSTIILVPSQSQSDEPSNQAPGEANFDALKASATTKAEALTKAVTTDRRWRLEDETMCQVFGFTLFGYIFGYGRTICFMDVEDIQQLAASQLSNLGIGPKYADGLMQTALDEFMSQDSQSMYSQLVEIGHSHFATEDLTEMVESIFENTSRIQNAS